MHVTQAKQCEHDFKHILLICTGYFGVDWRAEASVCSDTLDDTGLSRSSGPSVYVSCCASVLVWIHLSWLCLESISGTTKLISRGFLPAARFLCGVGHCGLLNSLCEPQPHSRKRGSLKRCKQVYISTHFYIYSSRSRQFCGVRDQLLLVLTSVHHPSHPVSSRSWSSEFAQRHGTLQDKE
jgi:hypothetical protein